MSSSRFFFVSLFLSLFLCFFVCLAFLGLACLAWRCLPLLTLLVVLGVVQRCSFLAWYYLALLGVRYVACLAWHCLALLGNTLALLGTVWHCFALLRVACLAWHSLAMLPFASRYLPCLASATGFTGSSCTFLFANALSVLCLPGGWVGWVGLASGESPPPPVFDQIQSSCCEKVEGGTTPHCC